MLLKVATVVWTGLAVLPWIISFGPLRGGPGGVLAATLVTAVPGFLLLAVSRQSELSGRLRQALFFLATSMLLTAGGNFLRLLNGLGISLPTVPGLGITTTVLIWALGLAALIRLPLTPPARGGWWRVATDITIAGIGMALAVFVIWELPGMRIAPPAVRQQIMLYNGMEVANLVVLSMILVRGPMRSIRRAVWWLSATIVIETVYLMALQFAIGRQSHDLRLPNSLFFLDYLAYLYAAVFFFKDAGRERDVTLWPESLPGVNPLPMLAVFGVGGLLILSVRGRPDPASLPLAIGIVVMALLLLTRLVGTTRENMRFLREEAAEDRRRHTEKLEMIERLAGGIAHNINNLMGAVLIQTDLATMQTSRKLPAGGSLKAIGESAREASALAERLLLASGRRRVPGEREGLLEVVRLEEEWINRAYSPDREVVWELAEGSGDALVNPLELESILRELVLNAGEATPPGGRVTIRVRDETLSQAPPGMSPPLLPGRYSVLEVADTGHGIEPRDLPHIFEPFFTTKPLHEGRGLGLSVVRGLVSSYNGGLLVNSVPGAGTRVSVYLPAAPAGVA